MAAHVIESRALMAVDRPNRPPGLVIAAPRSGAGKTTITLGLLRALHTRGVHVQPFKCGPDYIDPAFHSAAARRDSINLDTWAMRPELIATLVADAAHDADLCLVEGVMGLFDGVAEPGQTGRGATADLAATTGWPVLLILDVSGQSETAAALALGCKLYRSDVNVAGVILNRVASARHQRLVTDAMLKTGIPVLGALPRRDDLGLPERHLGLVQASETADLETRLTTLAAAISAAMDLDQLLAMAQAGHPATGHAPAAALPPPGQRIALARDAAFSFTYPHLLAGWRQAGAEIVPFSPLADEPPDPMADAVWLPGGYPELHAGTLAAASRFLDGVRAMADRGTPVHGECGGYMVLGAGIEVAEGERHAMAGLLGLETSYAKRRLNLGYRRVQLLSASPLGAAGSQLYGHEFHYSTVLTAPDDPLCVVTDATGQWVPERGSKRGRVSGTFFHVVDRA
jgi:cobyrinic acid a,c-diamide synthase